MVSDEKLNNTCESYFGLFKGRRDSWLLSKGRSVRQASVESKGDEHST